MSHIVLNPCSLRSMIYSFKLKTEQSFESDTTSFLGKDQKKFLIHESFGRYHFFISVTTNKVYHFFISNSTGLTKFRSSDIYSIIT